MKKNLAISLNEKEIAEMEKYIPEPEEEEEDTAKSALGIVKKKEEDEEEIPIKNRRAGLSAYVPPPLSLLKKTKVNQTLATSKQMQTSSSARSQTSALKWKWMR